MKQALQPTSVAIDNFLPKLKLDSQTDKSVDTTKINFEVNKVQESAKTKSKQIQEESEKKPNKDQRLIPGDSLVNINSRDQSVSYQNQHQLRNEDTITNLREAMDLI